MSAFRPTGGTGGIGLTAAQLAGLVSDGELSASETALLASIGTRASQIALEALAAQLAAKASTAALTATETALLAAIAAIPAAEVTPSGTQRLVTRVGGLAAAGWTKLTGIVAPALPSVLRSTMLPWANGSNSFLYTEIGGAKRATWKDTFIFLTSQKGRTFNLATSTWQDMPAPTYGPSAGSAIAVTGDTLLALGLSDGATLSSQVAAFDLNTRAWLPGKASMPLAALNPLLTVLNDGQLLAFGGYDSATGSSGSNMRASVQAYNPASDSWTVKANPFPVRLINGWTATRPDGKTFVFPSRISPDGIATVVDTRRFWLYDEAAGSAAELDPLPGGINVASTPAVFAAQADGSLLYVPTTVNPTYQRALRMNPAAAPGTQWAYLDFEHVAGRNLTLIPTSTVSRPTTSGHVLALTDTTPQTPFALYVKDLIATAGAETFYEIKN